MAPSGLYLGLDCGGPKDADGDSEYPRFIATEGKKEPEVHLL